MPAKPAVGIFDSGHALAPTCELYLPLTEGTGTPVDLAGGATFTMGGASWTTGVDGHALTFASWANVSYTPVFAGDETLVFAFDWFGAAAGVLGFTGPFGGPGGYLQFDASSQFLRWHVGGTNLETGTGVVTSGLYVIALVRRGTDREIWVDGVMEATGAMPAPGSPSNGLDLGDYNRSGGFLIDGELSMVGHWSHALSSGEIGTLVADPYILARGTAGGVAPLHLYQPSWRSPYPIVES